MNPLLTRKQCNAARALAIMGIVLHNYCHFLSFTIKESEFKFNLDQTLRWGEYLQHIDTNVLIHLFSWFGSYMVAAFMFLGGYGLVSKYENGGTTLSPLSFIGKQYRKLLALAIVPLLIYVAMELVVHGHTYATPWSLLAQLTMTINLTINAIPGLCIVPGPYWYLGLAMQLYVIYAFIHRFQGRKARLWIPVGLIALGYALHLAVPAGSAAAEWVRYNAPVAFIPFGLGLLAARYGRSDWLTPTRSIAAMLVSVALAFAFSLNYELWGLNYGLVSIAAVCAATLLRGRLMDVAVMVGKVSALIFVLHPLARFVALILGSHFIPNWPHIQLAIYITLTATAVYIYRKLKIDYVVNKYIGGK